MITRLVAVDVTTVLVGTVAVAPAEAPIRGVTVYNRTDCCGDRLSDYWVFVSDTPFDTAKTPDQQAATPGVWSAHETTTAGAPTEVAVGAAGRYVMVQQSGPTVLSLAEVEVLPAA
jgi:alpha-L-fucosidase